MIFSSADMLSQQQLKRLSEHKYSCSGSSFADPFMQPFWNWVTSKCPLWLAPNLMTLSGLFVNIATSLLLVWYSPTATQEVPRWAFLLCALGLFVYQTLDACDGKQARRTGTNTPLGELFDHGCDSISTVFVALAVCIAVKLGSYPGWMFFQCFVAITLFYCAHWQTYVSGTLRFGKFDVTEAQFSVMMIHIISAIFGSDIWATKLPLFNVELRLLPVATALSVSIIMCYTDIAVILSGGVGKNGSTVAVAHMCRSEMDYMDSALLGPGMLFLNQYFNTFINEYIILLVCLVYSVADLLHFSVIVCNQICAHLQIPLLRIVPKYAVGIAPASSSISSDKASATQSQADPEEACALLTTEEPPPYHESLMDCDTVHA
uniref:diacylglycerol cholinephosphotransferase n=1 Tax=Rhipicephalus zambeziensis TaxID=60191 RepID=A0A224Z4R0_9ACAR